MISKGLLNARVSPAPLRPLWWSAETPPESRSLFRQKRASIGLFRRSKPSKMNNCPICPRANKHKLFSESCWRQKRTLTENCQAGEGRYRWFENEFDLFRQLERGITYEQVCCFVLWCGLLSWLCFLILFEYYLIW